MLARFAEVKLIDDAMFARAWVDSRHHGRGLAGRALGAELRQRGVAQDDIEAALSELDPEQELATARELVARRLAGTAGHARPGPDAAARPASWRARVTRQGWLTASSARRWSRRPETAAFPSMILKFCLSQMTSDEAAEA